jgi:glutamine cyclotransferase
MKQAVVMTSTSTHRIARPRRTLHWLGALSVIIAGVAAAAALPRDKSAPVDGFRVVAAYPHDPQAFTQGLIVANGVMYEGTGQEGASSVRQVDLVTGRVQRSIPLNQNYFGEGIAVLGDKLYQLTWKNRLAIVYELPTLSPVSSFRYSGEGWGLTTDGEQLIMSDGTATLRFLDPKTFEVKRRVTVKSRSGQVDKLNELEFVNGEIYANIWYSDTIVRISPKTGDVLGWIDLSNLWPQNQRPTREHVLNGIAYDADQKKLYVTGKNWPQLYQIEIVPRR